jgi:hypothetical protein
MNIDFWTSEEAKRRCDALWDIELTEFPSIKNPDFQNFKEDYRARIEYIKQFGFVLFNQEFVNELEIELDHRKIKSFIETGSGYGTFTRILNNIGLTGKGYTLRLPEDPNKSHWGLIINPIYARGIESGEVIIGDLNEIKGDSSTDLIVSSWVPLGGGQEVQTYFNNNYYPKWYLVIGEGCGGCTGSYSYHNWLDQNYEIDYIFKNYQPFSMIHDNPILYKRKS